MVTTPSQTLVGTARRFGLSPHALTDPRIERLVQAKLDLDRDVAKRKAPPPTDAEVVRIAKEHGLDESDLSNCGPLRSVCKGIADARHFLGALRPAKLAPPAFTPKESALCFTTTNPKA